FNTEHSSQPMYFGLYNKYRGVLRMFIYLKPGTPIPSNNIVHSFHLSDEFISPLLNFSGAEMINVESPVRSSNQAQPYQTAATGTWYAVEHEIAYDRNIGNHNAAATRLLWGINSVNVSSIEILGATSGKLNGTITQP